MEKINIRSDLSIGDQRVSGKMGTSGLWIISEITICGKPTDVSLKELKAAMLEGNKIIDEANKGRELAKKVVKKTVDSAIKDKKKPAVAKEPKEKDKVVDISGGKEFKPDSGEKGKK